MSIFNAGIKRNWGTGIKKEDLVRINDLETHTNAVYISYFDTLGEMYNSTSQIGQVAYVSENKSTYLYTGSAWTNVSSDIINSSINQTTYYKYKNEV